jgi:hypothetical protein
MHKCTWISTFTIPYHVHVGGEGKTGKAVILKDWNESSFVSGAMSYSVTCRTHTCNNVFYLA